MGKNVSGGRVVRQKEGVLDSMWGRNQPPQSWGDRRWPDGGHGWPRDEVSCAHSGGKCGWKRWGYWWRLWDDMVGDRWVEWEEHGSGELLCPQPLRTTGWVPGTSRLVAALIVDDAPFSDLPRTPRWGLPINICHRDTADGLCRWGLHGWHSDILVRLIYSEPITWILITYKKQTGIYILFTEKRHLRCPSSIKVEPIFTKFLYLPMFVIIVPGTSYLVLFLSLFQPL